LETYFSSLKNLLRVSETDPKTFLECIDTVSAGFDEIREGALDMPDSPVEPLLMYFEKNWMSDLNLWNVSMCESKINNFCEGETMLVSTTIEDVFLQDITTG
jgi:hypothetical protein